jgi:opacity protein-like surface antigen
MKKLATLTLAAAALVTTAGAAAAQPHDGWQSINQRQANLEQRIDRGVARGDLTRVEAQRLHREFRQLSRLEARYRVNGLTRWERADLDRRFDRLAAEIRFERRDRDYGYGYGPRR